MGAPFFSSDRKTRKAALGVTVRSGLARVRQQMMQSLAGEVNTALSPRHHGCAMCFKLSSCRSQLAIWFQLANVWLTTSRYSPSHWLTIFSSALSDGAKLKSWCRDRDSIESISVECDSLRES